MKKWIAGLGTAAAMVLTLTVPGSAQQASGGGADAADTVPAAAPCPGGMGGMMGMEPGRRGGMMGQGQGHGRGMAGMRGRATGGGAMYGLQGGHGMRARGSGMMGGGMMGARPSALLARSETLDLSQDQVRRLEELQESERGMMRGMRAEMSAVRTQLQDVLSADALDMDAYRAALEARADVMVGHRMRWARLSQQSLEVLTTEQRDRWRGD